MPNRCDRSSEAERAASLKGHRLNGPLNVRRWDRAVFCHELSVSIRKRSLKLLNSNSDTSDPNRRSRYKPALASLPNFIPENSDHAQKPGPEYQQTRCFWRRVGGASAGAENGERFGGNGAHKLLERLRGAPLRLAVEAGILVPSKVRSAGNGAMPQRKPIASIRQSGPPVQFVVSWQLLYPQRLA
jgi:hypothetical protein